MKAPKLFFVVVLFSPAWLGVWVPRLVVLVEPPPLSPHGGRPILSGWVAPKSWVDGGAMANPKNLVPLPAWVRPKMTRRQQETTHVMLLHWGHCIRNYLHAVPMGKVRGIARAEGGGSRARSTVSLNDYLEEVVLPISTVIGRGRHLRGFLVKEQALHTIERDAGWCNLGSTHAWNSDQIGRAYFLGHPSRGLTIREGGA